MSKYQPKHAKQKRRRGTKDTPFIWLAAMFPAFFITKHYAPRLVTANLWVSFARGFGFLFALWFAFAFLIALFAVWNIEREQRNAMARQAEREARRASRQH